jgi:hypothetical protein
MFVTMICPNLNCRHTVVAPESARGKVVRCAHCKQLFMVPERRQAAVELLPEEETPSPTKEGKKTKTT